MKKFLQTLGYFLFFILALMYFMPKPSLYYFLETKLASHAIGISDENVKEHAFSLKIENANISLQGIESAVIEESEVQIFALYNTIECKNITLSNTLKSFVPPQISELKVRYTIWNPLFVEAKIVGEFGEANAKLHLLEKVLHLQLTPSDLMQKNYTNTLKYMRKTESGEYIYDKNF